MVYHKTRFNGSLNLSMIFITDDLDKDKIDFW